MRIPLALLVILLAGGALPAPSRADHGYDRDCSGFTSQQDAQQHHDAHPGDPDGLDADGDGRVCESNPCPCSSGSAPSPQPTATPTIRTGRVRKIVDGDTIDVDLDGGPDERVRVIGIDTPELSPSECGSWEAKAELQDLAERSRVRLVSDPSQGGTDTYGRTLAYVERDGDGLDLGRAMIAKGWSREYVYDDAFARLDDYRAARRKAARSHRGAWSLCAGRFHLKHRTYRNKRCGTTRYVFYAAGVSCRFAKRWERRMKRSGKKPPRWYCNPGDFDRGAYCQRGNRTFGWHPYD